MDMSMGRLTRSAQEQMGAGMGEGLDEADALHCLVRHCQPVL